MTHLQSNRPTLASRWGLWMLTAALLAGAPAAAEEGASSHVSFKFSEKPGAEVLQSLSQMYGVPFRAAAPIPQPISLDSQGPVNLAGAVAALKSAVADQGLSVRRADGVVKIVPRDGLLAVDIEVIVLAHSDPTAVAKVVLELFQTRDVWLELAAKDPKWAEQLLPHLSKTGSAGAAEGLRVEATPWPPLKAVIVKAPKQVMPLIRDFVENKLDAAEGRVRAAAAKAAAEARKRAAAAAKAKAEAEAKKRKGQKPPPPELTRTFQPMFVEARYIADYCQRLKGVRPQILPHNLLMFKTRKYQQFKDIEEVLAMLDVPDSTALQQYYIQLQHATATEVRRLLLELYAFKLEQPVTEAGAEQLIGSDAEAEDEAPVESADAAPVDGDVEEVAIPVGEVTIVADTENNALIVRTMPANIQAIRDLILKIDRPRGQVLIDVFIAEVSLDDTTELGVDFLQGGFVSNIAGDKGVWAAGQNFGIRGNYTGATYSLISDNIDLFIRALQTSSRLNIISRPSVTTLDNSPATFRFGEQVPLIEASNVNINGEVITSNVEYEPVDTQLVVTPHINAGGFVTMKIEQSIDEVSDEKFTISEQLEPQILINRYVQTNVRVYDGQTVFLGGFIDDKVDKTESKIPILGDLPIIGHAFKSTVNTRSKAELLIFITPHIVRTPQELLDATNLKRRQAMRNHEVDLPADELEIDTGAAPNRQMVLPRRGDRSKAVEGESEAAEAAELAPPAGPTTRPAPAK